MQEAIETFKINNRTVALYVDEDAQSPEEWGDDEVFLAYETGRRAAGRKGWAREPGDHVDAYHVFRLTVGDSRLSLGEEWTPGRYTVTWDNGANASGGLPGEYDTFEEADEAGREWADECNIRDFGTTEPDEDGYTYDVNEPEVPDEDGYVYVTRTPGTFGEGTTPEQVARSLVDEWNQYLDGDVYGYRITPGDDSCWGFYGIDSCRDEAKRAAEAMPVYVAPATVTELREVLERVLVEAAECDLHMAPLPDALRADIRTLLDKGSDL